MLHNPPNEKTSSFTRKIPTMVLSFTHFLLYTTGKCGGLLLSETKKMPNQVFSKPEILGPWTGQKQVSKI